MKRSGHDCSLIHPWNFFHLYNSLCNIRKRTTPVRIPVSLFRYEGTFDAHTYAPIYAHPYMSIIYDMHIHPYMGARLHPYMGSYTCACPAGVTAATRKKKRIPALMEVPLLNCLDEVTSNSPKRGSRMAYFTFRSSSSRLDMYTCTTLVLQRRHIDRP